MGRGRRKEHQKAVQAETGLDTMASFSQKSALPHSSYIFDDKPEYPERKRLRQILAGAKSPGERLDIAIEMIALELDQERPEHEKPTGLHQPDNPARFQKTSRVLQAVSDDPRFASDMQVMVDLDSTLFSMTGALQEMGVNLPVHEVGSWESDDDHLGDAIMRDYWKREDLMDPKNLSPEQIAERGELLGEFFRIMHTDEEMMKRSGTFEYAPTVIKLLRAHGVRIHLFTHRDPSCRQATEAWLDAMGIPYDSLYIEHPHAEGGRSDKVAFCEGTGIQFCIDDKPKTIRDAEAAGIEAFSLHWNYARDTIEESGADEGECWREILSDLFGEMERRIKAKARENDWDIGVPLD